MWKEHVLFVHYEHNRGRYYQTRDVHVLQYKQQVEDKIGNQQKL